MSVLVKDVKEFDIVYRIDKRKRLNFGLVFNSYGDTDSYNWHLPKGQIDVQWLNGSRKTCKQSKVRLVMSLRYMISFDPEYNIVSRLENGIETQRGYCKEYKVNATVAIIGTDKIIERVTRERLSTVAPLKEYALVCLENKCGRIQSCDQKLTMQSKCGSTVEIISSINKGVKDYLYRHYLESYYVGQEVTCTLNSLHRPNWIYRSKAMKRSILRCSRMVAKKRCFMLRSREVAKKRSVLRFILQKVEPTDIKVCWYGSTSSVSGVKAEDIPKGRCSSLICTRVNTTESEEGQGERSDNGSSSITTSQARYHSRTRHFSSKNRELVPGHTIAVQILDTDATVPVVWQDGTEEDVTTAESVYRDTHDFFPGEWVIQEGKTEKQQGVIQHVKYLERTAMVKWFVWSEDNQKPELVSTNEMSVYDLRKLPKYTFHSDSVVKRIPLEANKLGIVLVRCPEGYLIVDWIDGTREICWPQNLELIGELTNLKYPRTYDEDAEKSWKTTSMEYIVGDSNEPTLPNVAAQLDIVRGRAIYLMEILKQRNNKESCYILKEVFLIYDNCIRLDKMLGTSFFSLKDTHFQVVLGQICEKLKTCLVDLIKGNTLDRSYLYHIRRLQRILNERREFGEPATPLSPDSEPLPCLELLSMMKVRMDLAYHTLIISHIGDSRALTVMTNASDAIPVTSASFSNLPTIPEDSASVSNLLNLNESVIPYENDVYSLLEEVHVSHHFYKNQFEPTDRQRFFKAFQKEYKLLKESLPPGVWVRSYANRMDLLSVMIRGPSKTPYEDGLFLFDLQLSKEYPMSPPACHYISYSSDRLNPNLYPGGTVCISLLGTWMGHDTEEWSTNSTLLQLIVSIQGLILVSEPYYNEPGFEKQVESQKGYANSSSYNEFIILRLVQSMPRMLLEPPEVFKQEIYCHFAAHGESMCSRLQSWCNDANPVKPEFPLLPVSKGFKLSLNTSLNSFLDVLKDVLKANATSCDTGIVSSV